MQHINVPSMATLWKRKDTGYWYIRHGRQKIALRTQDERIANRKFNAWMREYHAGRVQELTGQKKTRLSVFIADFMKHQQTNAPATAYLYEVALNKAKDAWGDVYTQSITVRHIDGYIADLSRAGLAVPTINKNYRHLKAAVKKGIEWGDFKPIIKFPKALKQTEDVRFFSIPELQTLIGKMADDQEFADFCLFSAYTGLRSGEIIRLRGKDVDNPKGFLRVSSAQKNRQESRIPINVHARGIIDRRNPTPLKKLFRFNTVTWVSQLFREYAIKAGLEHRRFHDLRHTFASHLAMNGKDLKSIQELMRHKSIASTMVYAKVSPDHLKEVSDSLNYGPMPVKK
jgi:integrase